MIQVQKFIITLLILNRSHEILEEEMSHNVGEIFFWLGSTKNVCFLYWEGFIKSGLFLLSFKKWSSV